ncbi:mini-chromosome maintenance complex-binding protein [Ceraceosorus bombacis]|uniref:Mini-chromosome maintenance complex-binding protein n=1 Tax=Ceraceosorus bombacis TaxID=401625 RepID=A0A0P1B890_9BASI|nr:mini-chromosome maintenance complex-binding protein [Ceraceosorus bombacis]
MLPEPDPTTLTERTVLYAITPPAWSAWARHAWQSGSEPSDDVLSTMSGLSLDLNPRQSGAPSRDPSAEPVYLRKHSLAEAPGLGALLKIYDHKLAETLKVTDVIDVLGVLDFSLLPGADWSQGGAASSSSSAQLPALHVLHITPIAHSDEVPRPLTGASSRDDLVHYLASALGGDLLAAEWTLLGLLARIHSRRGSFTLGALEAGLLAGRLQLPDGTIVLCDESSMGEGTLKDRGVANVRELANLLSTRKLSYAFPFSSFDFETDLPFIVLSAGKSMLPVDVQVPLRSKNIVAAQAAQPTSSQLASWRTFLARARHVDLSIPESVAEEIQAEFVQARKEGQEGVREGQEDLLRRMAVARLVAISRGQREMSFDAWKQAVALDEERRSRIKQSSPATAASAANASSTASVLGGPALG